MRARTLAALVVSLIAMLVSMGTARADAKADVEGKLRAAMKAYDAFDYDGAKRHLGQAIAMAKKAKLDNDAVLARAHLNLGIVMYAVPDIEAAKSSFRSALQIDPNIDIDIAYKSPDLAKLLSSVRSQSSNEPVIGSGDRKPLPTGECVAVKGVQHAAIRSATGGVSQPIEVRVGPDVTRVSVMYRVEGTTDFVEVSLKRERDCRFTGAMPASAMQGNVLYYYIAAFANGASPVATKGSADLPNIVAITSAAAQSGDETSLESTLNHGGRSTKPTVLIAFGGGSGIGYVRGTTEGQNTVKRCCIGTSLLVATAELSYFATPQLSIGGVFRLGVPLGANLEGHSTTAPAGLVRMRYTFSPSGEGFHVLAQAGFGFLRNAVQVDNPEPGMDTDVLAQGPLLIGGGIGASFKLTRAFALFVDATVIGGIAVVNRLGSSVLNSGVAGDLTLGVAAVL